MARCVPYVRGEGSVRASSPLLMEEMEFHPHVHGDCGKRKAVVSDGKTSKRSKGSGRSTGGVVFRSPQRAKCSHRAADGDDDLKRRRPVASRSSLPRVGDVGSEFYYVGRTGKKRAVKRSDCSFHSAPIATSLLKGIVLDGDRAEVEDEDMDTLLGTMDMASCLFLAGYDKLKDAVQRTDTDVNSRVELGCMRAAWGADKKKLEAMIVKHRAAEDENARLVAAVAELQMEVAEVTEYAKRCQRVACKAQSAYTTACSEYAKLDEKYCQLTKADRAQGTGMRVVLRAARHVPSTSVAPEDKHVVDAA